MWGENTERKMQKETEQQQEKLTETVVPSFVLFNKYYEYLVIK
jgi:hypothetical protein